VDRQFRQFRATGSSVTNNTVYVYFDGVPRGATSCCSRHFLYCPAVDSPQTPQMHSTFRCVGLTNCQQLRDLGSSGRSYSFRYLQYANRMLLPHCNCVRAPCFFLTDSRKLKTRAGVSFSDILLILFRENHESAPS
jgi:hypothetical protein